MGNLLRWLKKSDNSPVRSPAMQVEALEPRQLLAAGPRIIDVFADNRGQVVLTLDRALNAATVTAKSVALYTTVSGVDKKRPATVSYNATAKQITITAANQADTAYKIWLNSKLVKGADNARLDGEFKGARKASGDGVAGGDYLAITQAAAAPLARFTTVYGNIDVALFNTQTPLTYNNFRRYANEKIYDGTFIHRSVKNFIVQGGGFNVNAQNQINSVKQYAAVPNEPNPSNPGDIRGTIAMAKLGGNANSATNQWFFNLGDNRANLDNQNGGFTVFGKVTGAAGLKVMDTIAALKLFNLDGNVFSSTPLVGDGAAAIERGKLDAAADLVFIRRIALKMDVVKVPAPAPAKASRARLVQPAFAAAPPAARPAAAATPSGVSLFSKSTPAVWQNAHGDLL